MITNIERVTLENVTFPAITICHWGSYNRDHYLNGTFIKSENILIQTDNISSLKNFIVEQSFYSKELNYKVQNFDNHVEYLKIPDHIDCVRFNGFVANKSIDLLKVISNEDYFTVTLKDSYRENISLNEHYIYSFNPYSFNYFSSLPKLFHVYITDNYLNSFENVQYQFLEINNVHDIQIEKESFENELSEPYNHCKESTNYE